MTGLTLRVEDERADQEELSELTGRLRLELLDLDVRSVERAREGEPPPGTRAVDVNTVDTLMVTLAQTPVLAAVVAAVRSWLVGSPRRSVRLEIDGDVLELTGQPSREQRRLVDEWLTRRSGE